MNENSGVVLITGSTGYIGKAVTKRLGPQYKVIGLNRSGPPCSEGASDCLKMDVSSDESVRKALLTLKERYGSRVVSVIHLAAYYDFSGEPSPLYEEVTVRGTERLLRGLTDSFDLEQFIFSSTMLVHAPCEPGQKINEDWPLEPKWDYPRSKVATEKVIQRCNGNTPYALLRIAGVYDEMGHLLPLAHQAQRVYEEQLTSRVFPGDLDRGQAALHLDDLVDAIELLVQKRAKVPSELTLLLGEPDTMSYGEIQDVLGEIIHGDDWTTIKIPKPVAKAGAWIQDVAPLVDEPFVKPWMIEMADDHYALDISRARETIGWNPKHSFRETLPIIVEALIRDPVGWYKDNGLEPPDDLEE